MSLYDLLYFPLARHCNKYRLKFTPEQQLFPYDSYVKRKSYKSCKIRFCKYCIVVFVLQIHQ
jgi:hypothetical protein